MKVSEVMTEAVVTESAEDTLTEAAATMREHQTGSLLVMEGDRLTGIFTERDVLKAIAQGLDPQQARVREVMTKDVITISPHTKLKEAAALMASKWIRHLPVVEGERVVGLISQRDLTGVFAEALDEPEQMQRIAGEDLVRSRRLKRIEAGDLD
jgi:CBS domain-containing protein